MDPHVVFDCQNILPNKFALAVAAAARCPALNRGGKPRLDLRDTNGSKLALQECPDRHQCLPDSSSTITGFRGDGDPNAAAAPVSCLQETDP